MKSESSGAQNDVEVRLHSVHPEAEVQMYSCSKDTDLLTEFTFPFGSQYLHGFVVDVGGMKVKRVKWATSIYGRRPHIYYRYLLSLILMDILQLPDIYHYYPECM